MPHRLLAWLLAALTMTSGITARAEPAFQSIVVLGDSLSDIGNAGRFSNGPAWVEVLARRLNLPLRPSQVGGTDFAVGGARLDPGSGPASLRAQAEHYLAGPRSSGRTLYVVYGGGNDLLAAMGRADPEAVVDAAGAALRDIVMNLMAHGAADLLIPNLPDIGMTPAVQGFGPAALAQARVLSERFNAAVAAVWRDAEAAHPGIVRVYRLDVHALAESVRRDPQASGFREIRQPCAGLGRCDGYLFWDDVHPTTQAHARLAEAALRVLKDSVRTP
ncbi:MAG: SGNH/GDSL hydrolase family protein [Rhodopila sp.]